MKMDAVERDRLIEQYATGPQRLRTALQAVPADAMKWRPGPGEFSVHEIAVHCADSETNAAVRIRYLMAEAEPVIMGYDPDNWARRFDYHSHSLEAALATVEAVRANTAPLIRQLDEASLSKAGMHTESGRYTGVDWLQIYAAHVEEHIEQIERTVEAWRAANE